MTSRERVKCALQMEQIDAIPLENEHGAAAAQFKSDVTGVPFTYGTGRSSGIPKRRGIHTDVWGCRWSSQEDGAMGEVKESLVEDLDDLSGFYVPWDALEHADLSRVNEACAATSQYVCNKWMDISAQPFQRLQYLRGAEQLYLDLAMEEPGLVNLIEKVHAYYKQQAQMWCETDVDAIHIEDDWGSQQSLLISPKLWRELFKPLYRDYIAIAHAHGKQVIMHSDGYILDILEDLIEIGLDAVNAQLFCMDMQQLNRRFGGRIAFWGEIDRQYLLPFGTQEEIRAGVRRVADAFLRDRKTGIVGMCFAGNDIAPNAVQAVYSEWEKISAELFGPKK